MDSVFQSGLPPPVEDEAVGVTELLKLEVIIGDRELVVERALGVVVEGLAAVFRNAPVGKPIRVGWTAAIPLDVEKRKSICSAVFPEQDEGFVLRLGDRTR